MAKLYGKKLVNGAAAHHGETQRAIKDEADAVERRARGNLEAARASTEWVKIDTEKAHQTKITASEGTGKYGAVDRLVSLEGDNAMALEFGHKPSGFFDPEVYGRKTKAPTGLYILWRAALPGAIL